ncbi:MAG: NDP-sugar synthase [Calditrichaceae bacterium]
MKAMIFAAGLGTRLHPLTAAKPKALVEVGGVPMIDLLIRRLIHFGFDEIIINVHHFADQIISFIKSKNSYYIRIEISVEDTLLDTGGGLQKAAWFFNDQQPFLLHNVDVLSDLDLKNLMNYHQQTGALATLAVRDRKTSRYLLFDRNNQLCGWKSVKEDKTIITRPSGDLIPLSFTGIQLLNPEILNLFNENAPFPIIDFYLRLAGMNRNIQGFRDDHSRWIDLGNPANLELAEKLFKNDFRNDKF